MKIMDRVKQIDGLRGIAALAIVFFHLYYRYQCLFFSEPKNILLVSYWGEIWVGLFFVIAGFFLFPSKEISPMRYLIKRFYRLYPTYSVAVIMIFVIVSEFGLSGRETSTYDLALNLLLVNGFIGTPYVDSAHWYMTYIIAFSLVASICILVKQYKHNTALLVVLTFNISMRIFSRMLSIPILSRILQILSGGGIPITC